MIRYTTKLILPRINKLLFTKMYIQNKKIILRNIFYQNMNIN